MGVRYPSGEIAVTGLPTGASAKFGRPVRSTLRKRPLTARSPNTRVMPRSSRPSAHFAPNVQTVTRAPIPRERVRSGGYEPSPRLDDREGSAAVVGRFARCWQLCRFLDAGNNEGLGTLSLQASKKRQDTEVAESWAPAGQRALWGLEVNAALDGGCNTARKRSGCVDRLSFSVAHGEFHPE
jgi:hypothetical protein